MTLVRIEQLTGTGVRQWHELDVDEAGTVECPTCRERLPIEVVVEHLQPRPSGAVFALGADEDPVDTGALRLPDEW